MSVTKFPRASDGAECGSHHRDDLDPGDDHRAAAGHHMSKEYLRSARQPAPEGKAYLAKLAAMPPAQAAAELAPLFRLVAPEDIASELADDLGMDRTNR